jgi:hypothetical protein
MLFRIWQHFCSAAKLRRGATIGVRNGMNRIFARGCSAAAQFPKISETHCVFSVEPITSRISVQTQRGEAAQRASTEEDPIYRDEAFVRRYSDRSAYRSWFHGVACRCIERRHRVSDLHRVGKSGASDRRGVQPAQ